MSKIANLHSILSSKWLIESSAMNALIPDLMKLLKGETPVEVKTVVPGYLNISGDYWDEDDDFEENHEDEETSTKNTVVAILPIKGAITKYSQWCGPMGTREMRSYMDRWKTDDSIAAVVLDIDSGGGQVAGTAEFAEYLNEFPKPVVAYTDGMICSAAYWLASASNEIWANKHSEEIGSIGAMCKGLILDGIIEKQGGQIIEEYATKSTKKNHVWRELKKGNVEPLIKESLDPTNEKFLSMVKSYRPQLSEEVLNGEDFLNAETSLANGLIDHIGTKQEAIDRAFELSRASNSSEENNSNSNTNNNMSKENSFPKLAAVLGKENVEAKKAHVFAATETVSLTVEQLSAIEAALSDPGDAEAMANLKTQLNEAKTAQTTAENKVTAIEAAVNSAIEKAGLESEKKETAAENVALLSEKVEAYGSQPGAMPTQVKSTGDKSEEKDAFVDEIAAKLDTSNI